MQNEESVAKENVENIKIDIPEERELYPECKQHKQTCQRFLDFLEVWCDYSRTQVKKKIQDLKSAIKIYEENGI
jgi:ABC-type uncharacterized transport system ATPase subunit